MTIALSAAVLERLADVAVERFEARAFDEANDALELLLAANVLPIPLRLTYAVCLTELGRDDEARAVSDRVARSIAELAAEDPRRPILEQLAASMTPFVAGGECSRGKRDALKASAEKWLPRLGR